MPVVSVIVLNWNTREMTQACLEKVRACTDDISYELILVDNGSIDGSADALAGLCDRVVRNPENLGFAAGFNRGIAVSRGEFVCLLNSDTAVTPGWLGAMVDLCYRNERIGLVGPRTQTPVSAPGQLGTHGKSYMDVITTERIAFFCVLIPRMALDKVGLLDEAFGQGNFEDDDYCRRLLDAGYRFGIAGKSFVYHHGSHTFEANQVDYGAVYQHARTVFEKKWGPIDRTPVTCQIGVAITTRNRPAMLRQTLERVVAHTPTGARIVVVDDASEGDENALLVAEYPSVQYIHNGQRKGIAGSMNVCLEALRGCEFLFLLDDDCYPTSADWCEFFIQAHRASGIHHFCYIPPRLNAPTEIATFADLDLTCHAWTFGAMLFLTWRALDVVGGFNLEYGVWGCEHVDYSHRIFRAGLTCGRGPFVSVEGSGERLFAMDLDQEGVITSSVTEAEKSWFGPRNNELFGRERYGDTLFRPVITDQALSPVVSVILDSGGDSAMASRCLDTLKRTTSIPHEVVILDMGRIQDGHSLVGRADTFIHETARRPLAERWNRGLEIARAPYILLLDRRVELYPETIYALLDQARAWPHLGAIGGNLDGSLDRDDQVFDLPDFSCLLLPRSTFDQIGWFDPGLEAPVDLYRDFAQRMAIAGLGSGRAVRARYDNLLGGVHGHEVQTRSSRSAYLKKWGNLEYDPSRRRTFDPIDLSILVPSVPQRAGTFLPKILAQLAEQTRNHPEVEVLAFVDNQRRTIGRKRNDMIKLAQGRYVVFVDDDDRISPDYVKWLLAAIENNPGVDCICFDAFYSADGVPDRIVHYGLEYENENTPEAYLRKPNHLMCFRRALALQVPYPDLSFKEDTIWGEAIFPRIRNQARIGTILYFYDYVSHDKIHPVD